MHEMLLADSSYQNARRPVKRRRVYVQIAADAKLRSRVHGFYLTFALVAAVSIALFGQASNPVVPASTGRGRGAAASVDPQKILLWENGAPGAMGDTDADKPSLTFYKAPGRTSGTSVIVAPGGAYRVLSTAGGEGIAACYWLNLNGISAFLLRYRLSPYHHPIELGDAERAVRQVRARAAEFGIDPAKIGFMGFSAGGHLAATLETHFTPGNLQASDVIDRVSSRPDFVVLAYPVISFQETIAGSDVLHAYASSGLDLLGDHPDQALLDDLSDELHVTAQTPPTFLAHGTVDRLVTVDNSIAMYSALKKAGVPTELHTFEDAGHGFGVNLSDPAVASWPGLMIAWLKARGILAPTAATTAREQ